MKKNYAWMAMAVLAMTGCSQNEITEVNPDVKAPIGFSVYTGVQTRGVITDNTDGDGTSANGLKASGKGFGIMAYLTPGTLPSTDGKYTPDGTTKSLFMNNQQATWDGGKSAWTYTPKKFWPESSVDKVSFFAYAPYSKEGATQGIEINTGIVSGGTNTDPLITFTMQDNQKDLVDLVVSTAQKDKGKSDNSGTISFPFKHVLSRVAIEAAISEDLTGNAQTKVYLTGIKFNHDNKLAKKAIINMNTGAWDYTGVEYLGTDMTGSRDYVLTDGSAGTGVLNMTTPSWYGYTTPSLELSNNLTSVFLDNHYLFFIPVADATGTALEGDVTMTVDYDIVTLPSAPVVTSMYKGTTRAGGDPTAAVSSQSKTISLGENSFQKGTAYLYKLTIKLNTIEVSVDDSSMGWGTVTEVTDPAPVP